KPQRIRMIVLLIFLLSALILGGLVANRLKFFAYWERAAAALIISLAASSTSAFAISNLLGSLTATSIALSAGINLVASYFILKHERIRIKPLRIVLPRIGLPQMAVLLLIAIMLYFNAYSIYDDPKGNIWAISNTWADYALHIGIINSFALRDNFPPIYPNLEGAPMRYPFMVDFLSAIFVTEGVPIVPSITFPNMLLIICLVGLTCSFLSRFLGKKEIAAIALILFFLNGNLGFTHFIDGFNSAPDKVQFLANLSKPYSYLPEANIQFMNLLYSVFIPQRAALMGFPIVMLVFIMLLRIHKREAAGFEYFLAGFLLSLLPLVHASSFGVAAFIAFSIFCFNLISYRRLDPQWLLFGLPLILIALPQLLFINEQQRSDNFFGPEVGWMSKSTGYMDFAKFWVENAGLVLIFGIVGLFLLKRQQLIFMLPFIAIFIIANLIRFQPWEWDNVKILMYWYFAFSALAALAIFKGYEKIGIRRRQLGAVFVFVAIFLCTLSGILTLIAWNSSNAQLWSASDVRMANFISENTGKNEAFAVAGKHNQLVYTLAGRQILSGYDGHLWSHGLSYLEQAGDNRRILSEIDLTLIRKWNINYVFVGPAERNEWGANLGAYESNPDLEEIYISEDGLSRLFRVK
ncbi:MAG: hypothetical protein ABH863_02515, partial [Candidatus Micrarchaeota archaeon]